MLVPLASTENTLLTALSGRNYTHLFSDSEIVFLASGKVLYVCGEPIKYVYFPLDSVVFLLAFMKDGATPEVGMVGFEGMLGAFVTSGDYIPSSQAVVHVAGEAVRLRADVLKEKFDQGGFLQSLLLRYMQTLYVQVSQAAACNRIHHMEARLCRWLLMMQDRMRSNDLSLTQEFIANMLGTPRPYITVAAGLLHRDGLIHCQRGQVTILNRSRLEDRACECYRLVKNECSRLLGDATLSLKSHHAAPAYRAYGD